MRVNKQKQITLINNCGAIYDEEILKEAILNYTEKPVVRLKKIFMYGRYPAVSIYLEKIHLHRLIAILLYGERAYDKKLCVHHIDGNKMNSLTNNIGLMEISKHQSIHNIGKKISEIHKGKISAYNKERRPVNRNKNGRYEKTYNIHEVKEE